MMRNIRLGSFTMRAVLICLLLVGCVGCGKLFTTNIADIQGHPRDYAGKEVTISGEVMESFSLIVIKYFTLRDSTGEITVITERPLPAKGEKLKVTGLVREAFSIGPQTALVLVEGSPATKR